MVNVLRKTIRISKKDVLQKLVIKTGHYRRCLKATLGLGVLLNKNPQTGNHKIRLNHFCFSFYGGSAYFMERYASQTRLSKLCHRTSTYSKGQLSAISFYTPYASVSPHV